MIERATLTRDEAAEYLGISKWLLWQETKRGNILSFKIGTRVLYRKATLEAYMSYQEEIAKEKTGRLDNPKNN